MPTISVFIRVNDLPKWKAIEGKSEFLHNALNSTATVQLTTTELTSEPFEPSA